MLEEVNEDLLSLETREPGVMRGFAEVRGVSVADTVAERRAVSRVNGFITSSFFAEPLPSRKSDLQEEPLEDIEGDS